MNKICMFVLLVLPLFLTIAGRKVKGPWYYRGIRWICDRQKKAGNDIPGWLKEGHILVCWMIMVLGSGILMVCQLQESQTAGGQITSLDRPAWGEGTRQEEMTVWWEKKDGTVEKEDIKIDVKEAVLSKEETDQLFQDAKDQIDKILDLQLEKNTVRENLHFPEQLENNPVLLSWNTDNPEVMDWMGNIGEKVSEKGTDVMVSAQMCIGEREDIYQRSIKVFPERRTCRRELELLLSKDSTEGEKKMILPEKIGENKLVWKKNGSSVYRILQILTLLCPVLLLAVEKQRYGEMEKKEQQQMMQDYPEIVSKLTLLLSAGINLRKAMGRIGTDYQHFKKKGETRKAYQIILETCEEMDRGVSEKEAYEHLGERCGLLCYRTLAALLVQHLQKGSRGVEVMLEEEVQKAQILRQQQARVLGEQAATKLLFPMILMLMIVFIILVVPAWITFL